ncbi:MAG: hypothetical protein ACRDGR_00880 [bacterium]
MSLDRSLGIALVTGTALAISGCLNVNDSSPEPAGSDEAEIRNVVLEEMFDYADPDVRWHDEDSDAANVPIQTNRWRREVLRFQTDIGIEIDRGNSARPTALVTVIGKATGILHLWEFESEVISHHRKDFTDTGTRRMLFERFRRIERPIDLPRDWGLLAISGVEIVAPGATRQIRSVGIHSGDVDRKITGVRDLVRIEDLLHLPQGVDVAVTVDTGDAGDAVFLHLRHRETRPLGRRIPLESNGDGTFSGVFHTDDGRPGVRHIGIDVLSHGTLYDNEEPYDSVGWGIPYILGADLSGG